MALKDDRPRTRISRSTQKAEADHAMDLAKQLVANPLEHDRLPLDDRVYEALKVYGRIRSKSRGALKRQLAHIASLLLALETEELELAMGVGEAAQSERELHLERLESWRRRILHEGDVAIDAFVVEFPQADRQRLRQVARNAKKGGKPFKQLFALLREASEA